MQQLGALDNLMVEADLPNIPLHMSALMIYDTGGKKGTTRFAESIRDRFEKALDLHFPILRCRLESVAFQLDKAYWVEDPHFNLTYHITRVALPAPGDWQQVYRLFGQFHAQPLDRTRPLWEIMIVEGLDRVEGIPRGSTALFLKIHHAVMDGKSALRLISSLHSLDSEPEAPTLADSIPMEKPVDKSFQPPSWWEKYGRAWWHSIERPIDLASTLVKLLPQVLHSDSSDTKAKRQTTPHVRFNQPVDPDRVIGHVRIDMKQLRRLEKKHHCTINDIALCIVAGAVRDDLLRLQQLPTENLQALMPIDIRRKDKDGSIGNHLSVAKISLYTSISDVKKRLLTISEDSSQSKKRSRKGDSHAMLKLVDDIHPAIILWLGQWLVSSGRIDTLPPTVNTVVTNVPGLPADAYMSGVKLIDYLGFGPLAPNMGLFHTVSSTPNHLNISFLSTAALLDDGSDYRASLNESLAEVLLL